MLTSGFHIDMDVDVSSVLQHGWGWEKPSRWFPFPESGAQRPCWSCARRAAARHTAGAGGALRRGTSPRRARRVRSAAASHNHPRTLVVHVPRATPLVSPQALTTSTPRPPPPPSAAAQARKAPPRRVVPCRRPACSVLPSARRGAMVSQWCPHRPGKLPLLKGAQAAAALWYVGGAACQHTPSALAASRPRRCMRARLAPICLSN